MIGLMANVLCRLLRQHVSRKVPGRWRYVSCGVRSASAGYSSTRFHFLICWVIGNSCAWDVRLLALRHSVAAT